MVAITTTLSSIVHSLVVEHLQAKLGSLAVQKFSNDIIEEKLEVVSQHMMLLSYQCVCEPTWNC